MKYILIAVIFTLFTVCVARADYLKDVQTLGYASGEGLACGARLYPKYEIIARTYLISAAKTDKEQAKGEYEYNEAKARAYLSKKRMGLIDCDVVNEYFNQQKIFKTKVYKKGKLIMPDGKIIIPRKSYDVTKVYDENADEKSIIDEKYENIVKRRIQQAKKQGIYDKIKRAEAQNKY